MKIQGERKAGEFLNGIFKVALSCTRANSVNRQLLLLQVNKSQLLIYRSPVLQHVYHRQFRKAEGKRTDKLICLWGYYTIFGYADKIRIKTISVYNPE